MCMKVEINPYWIDSGTRCISGSVGVNFRPLGGSQRRLSLVSCTKQPKVRKISFQQVLSSKRTFSPLRCGENHWINGCFILIRMRLISRYLLNFSRDKEWALCSDGLTTSNSGRSLLRSKLRHIEASLDTPEWWMLGTSPCRLVEISPRSEWGERRAV